MEVKSMSTKVSYILPFTKMTQISQAIISDSKSMSHMNNCRLRNQWKIYDSIAKEDLTWLRWRCIIHLLQIVRHSLSQVALTMHRWCLIKNSTVGRSGTRLKLDQCLKCQSMLTRNTQSYFTAKTCETSNWWRTSSKFCLSNNSRFLKCRCSKSTSNTRWPTSSTWVTQRQRLNKGNPKRKALIPRTKRIS